MEEDSGLFTREALLKLYQEINIVIHQFKITQKSKRTRSWIKDTLHHQSHHTTINWISASIQLWTILSLFLASFLEDSPIFLIESLILTLLLVVNLSFVLYDNKLRHYEVPNRVEAVLERIKNEADSVKWLPQNYPNISSPISPCITSQWTYRDGNLVNLPWSLLVKDDVILMRPGQISPGYCEALDKTSDYSLLHSKEVFSPSLQSHNEIFSAPKSRKPLENKKYRLLETPYLNNLRIYLEQALDRPATQLNQLRHLVMIKTIERFVLPFVFLSIFGINVFRYFYPLGKTSQTQMFLIVPSTAILPLLPLMFPIAWNLLNYVGMARFESIYETSRNAQATRDNPLEEDADTITIDYTGYKFTRRDIWNHFVSILKGDPYIMTRSSNILHVLGSVTALGCVDKKGILSWPNPTAEKVFFLHNNEMISNSSSLENVNDLTADGDSAGGTPHRPNNSIGSSSSATAEVLDLTHNHTDPFRLHFDDQEWQRHLTSLKPLGLAILLNTCNVETQAKYVAFCSHITCEAIYNENLVPVINRRCLCELAKEIGFVDQAQKIFSLEQQLSTFRHLQPEMVRRDNKYARSLQLSTKLKFPFPHMFAVVVKELSSGSMQLLSEGTADIILDSCVDYWDGHDLCPLTPSDRKKAQDFYQRSSLTAYCTAFAYRPLNKCVSNKMSEVYLELPSDCRHLYMNYRSPTPIHWDCKSVLEPKIKTPLGQFYSTDSLLYNDCPAVDVSDAESCFQLQCNQVFIGMVTMQYQPLTDMVQLIEQLERACIRFVHFSKENELRSRVFSEKMGLESGWNCHISLLSERTRRDSGQSDGAIKIDVHRARQRRLSQSARKLTQHNDDRSYIDYSNLETSRAMSFSAPSAINMEHSVVKFESDLENFDDKSTESVHNNAHNDWQSLSCLTDSTEQSAPINFDMSNRAKLPRGIDKIRPHIELIDNVPLLVSLFTDCTPQATREMLNIMQEYGEVVCILGSSANYENAGIFMQADASIGVHPLYPQRCQRIEVFERPHGYASPVDLARDLNSVACCLSLKREDPISFYRLIMEARHYTTVLWSCIQFWLSCCVILSLIQLAAGYLMVPAPLTTGQVLWLCCVAVPVLSVSLMAFPVDPEVMKKPQGKNQVIVTVDVSVFILWCYGLKFLPTLCVVLVTYLGILTSHCGELCSLKNCTCTLFYLPVADDVDYSQGNANGWSENGWSLSTARLILVFIVLLHFVLISIGFVHRDHLIFQKQPNSNFLWLTSIFTLLLTQSLYTILSYVSFRNDFSDEDKFKVPLWVTIFASISPILVLVINEVVKRQEITVNRRFHKRARLDFGTKLGMNSPF